MSEKNEYINSIDLENEWWIDAPFGLGNLIRIRSIIIAFLIQLATGITSFFAKFPHEISALLVVIAIAYFMLIFQIRINRIRQINTDNKTGGAILRVAVVEGANSLYKTVARSDNLADERDRWSVPEMAGRGISSQLLARSCQGAYLIRDRIEAARCGLWELTHNDTLKDVRDVLTLPVNGYFGGNLRMLGILHITVAGGRLTRSDWLWARAFADVIGLVLAIVYASEIVVSRDQEDQEDREDDNILL